MLNLQKLSIRTKLTIIIISVSLVAIFVGFFIITVISISNLKKDLINQSSLISKLVGEYSEYALVFEDTKTAQTNLDNLKSIPFIINAELYTGEGQLFASLSKKPSSFKELIVENHHVEFNEDKLCIFEPIISADDEYIGSLYMVVSPSDLNKNVHDYILWMIIIIVFVSILITVLASRFQKIISRPILKLAELTKKITDTNDYTIRIQNRSNDEIGILYDGFNNMLEEIVSNEIAKQKAQNELIDSQEQFRTFMEMLPAAAYIKYEDSTFFYVNKFLSDKYNADKWIGKKISSERPSEKKHFSTQNDNEALSSVQHIDEFIYDSNNELKYFESWKFPLYRKNKPTLIGGIGIDITTRKFAEKQLNYYINELERNNKELEEFNYVASHDLREPLRTITSYCDLLSEDIGRNINDMVIEDIKFITDATTRMNILIQDLLQLSRAGRVEFETKPIDLNKIIIYVLQDLELKIKETNTSIHIGKLPVVMGDAVQISRVFQNLFTNAIKFKSENDPVIKVQYLENENSYEITIADNGIGIEKQYQNQIFSAFKRLHSREKYEGTGIGLAICKKIIERHNGSIGIESEPGKGSIFKITLKKLDISEYIN